MTKILTSLSMMKIQSNKSPMLILTSILACTWLSTLNMTKNTSSPWSAIILILAFNGGLMILYVFTISMVPKSKSEEKLKQTNKIMMIALILMMSTSQLQMASSISKSYQSKSIIIMSMILLSIIMTISTMTVTNPFKTMKSSK